MMKMERTREAELKMAELAWAEHDWRWDACELENPDEDGNDDWSRRAVRFENGEATEEDWTAMAELED